MYPKLYGHDYNLKTSNRYVQVIKHQFLTKNDFSIKNRKIKIDVLSKNDRNSIFPKYRYHHSTRLDAQKSLALSKKYENSKIDRFFNFFYLAKIKNDDDDHDHGSERKQARLSLLSLQKKLCACKISSQMFVT